MEQKIIQNLLFMKKIIRKYNTSNEKRCCHILAYIYIKIKREENKKPAATPTNEVSKTLGCKRFQFLTSIYVVQNLTFESNF